MGRCDIFKHLYEISPACRSPVLDFRTPVLIDRRTDVLSNGCPRGGIAMTVSGARHVGPPLRLTRRGRVVLLGVFFAMVALASVVLFTTASHA
ncbi:hypothetical protein Aca07nite_15710 [Actinoplanes capillaceus]|uniref:Uncharacterized protein n=1 Tax=Actinoplanes campanulatus TaxID=113559 RepID=A0ABQ3WB77_9ACTN|nr:hypothetical protein Aca07nite_15710 [Actinoplanes capillaceus]